MDRLLCNCALAGGAVLRVLGRDNRTGFWSRSFCVPVRSVCNSDIWCDFGFAVPLVWLSNSDVSLPLHRQSKQSLLAATGGTLSGYSGCTQENLSVSGYANNRLFTAAGGPG